MRISCYIQLTVRVTHGMNDIKFATGVLHKRLSEKYEFRENWRSDSHTLLTVVTKFLAVLSMFPDRSR